jgi:hypothetical protein
MRRVFQVMLSWPFAWWLTPLGQYQPMLGWAQPSAVVGLVPQLGTGVVQGQRSSGDACIGLRGDWESWGWASWMTKGGSTTAAFADCGFHGWRNGPRSLGSTDGDGRPSCPLQLTLNLGLHCKRVNGHRGLMGHMGYDRSFVVNF